MRIDKYGQHVFKEDELFESILSQPVVDRTYLIENGTSNFEDINELVGYNALELYR